MAYTHKQNITRNRLKHALIKLMAHKPFTDITVHNITALAEYDRSSFYRYYDDKYCLVADIEEDLIAGIEKRYHQVLGNTPRSPLTREQIGTLLAIFKEPSVTVTVHSLLGNNGDISFEPRLRQMFSRLFTEMAHTHTGEDVEIGIVKDFLAGLFIQTLQLQTSPNFSLPTEKFADILYRIYFDGIATALHPQQKRLADTDKS